MHKIILDNYEINYQVFFKNIKHMYIRIKHNSVQVTCNKRFTYESIESFIMKHKKWILNQMKQEKISLYNHHEMYLWGKKYPIKYAWSLNQSVVFTGDSFLVLKNFEKHLESFYHQEIMNEISNILKENKLTLAGYFKLDNLVFKTQLMTSRLGSCHASKGIIKLNTILGRVDKEYLKLVLFHELSHLIHQNHSSDFHDLLEKLIPNHKKINRRLSKDIRRFDIGVTSM